MPAPPNSLLPPNATAVERAIEAVAAERIDAVPAPQRSLWNPDTCPLPLLPFLAWALSIDDWDPSWPEAVKRQQVRQAIPDHRHKGSAAVVRAAIARRDLLAGEGIDTGAEPTGLVEWWQDTPRGQPHTFRVEVPVSPGSPRGSAAFVAQLKADIDRVKPARSHMSTRQRLGAALRGSVVGRSRLATFRRLETDCPTVEPEPTWRRVVQAETGEPLEAEAGGYLFGEGIEVATSITAWGDSQVFIAGAWAEQFGEALPGVAVVNAGVPGEETTQLLARIQAAPAALLSGPQVIWSGLNDIALSTDFETVPASAASNIAAAVALMLDHGSPFVAVLAISQLSDAGPASALATQRTNALLRQIPGAHVFDAQALLRTPQAFTAVGVRPSEGDRADLALGLVPRSMRWTNPDGSFDHIHLTAAANRVLGAALAEFVAQAPIYGAAEPRFEAAA